MKNNKLTQKSNKKTKRLFLILTAGALVASATAIPAIMVATSGKPSKSDLQITFNAKFRNSNSSVSFKINNGTSIQDLLADKEKAEKLIIDTTVSSFCGWAKSSDFDKDGLVDASKIIKATQKFTTSANLTAVTQKDVKNANAIEWCYVRFDQDAEKVASIVGNTYIMVPKGYGIQFQDINHPSVTVPSGSKFEYWTADKSTEYKGLITSNVTLTPKITASSLKLTFVPGNGAEIETGQSVVPVEVGQTFGELNIPTVKWTAGGKFFAGWYSEDGGTSTWDNSKLFSNTTVVSSNQTAYARFEAGASTDLTLVHAIIPTGETFTYDSNADFLVSNKLVWKMFNHPNPQSTTKSVKGWQYSETDPTGAHTWKDIDPDKTQFNTVQTVWIQPVMQTKVTQLAIVVGGQETAEAHEFQTGVALPVQSYTFPTDVSQKSTWSVKKYDKQTEQWVAATTSEVAINVIKNTDTESTASIKVMDAAIDSIELTSTSSVDGTSNAQIIIDKTNPYVHNMDFFTVLDGVSYELKGIADKDVSTISLISADGKTKETVNKTSFNYEVSIADRVVSIPNDFLAGCTSFNKPIHKSTGETVQPIKYIGNNFLEGAAVFNDESIGTLLNNVIVIGDNFMAGNKAFDACDIHLQHATVIGNNFFRGNAAFAHQIIMPVVAEIYNNFLAECKAFNSDIIFPSTIVRIGSGCMYNCDAFVSTITMDANPQQEDVDQNIKMFATSDGVSTHAAGFKFTGTYGQSAHDTWYDLPNEGREGLYRKSTVVGEKIITSIEVDSSSTHKTQFVVGDTFTTSGLKIKVNYETGPSEIITSGWTTTPISEGTQLNDAGTGMINVHYREKQCQYQITVEEATVIELPTYLSLTADGLLTVNDSSQLPATLNIQGKYKSGEKEITVTEIGSFGSSTTLTSVTIPNTVKTIDVGAFAQCTSLASAVIGSGVETIGKNAFNSKSETFTSLTFVDTTSNYTIDNGKVIAITTDAEFNAAYYKDALADQTITKATRFSELPDYLELEAINDEEGPGYEIHVKSGATIPEGLTQLTIKSAYIDKQANQLLEVKAVGDFTPLHELESVTICDGITSINAGALNISSLANVTIPWSVQTIGKEAIGTTSLANLSFKDNTSIFNKKDDQGTETQITISDKATENAASYTEAGGWCGYEIQKTSRETVEELPAYLNWQWSSTGSGIKVAYDNTYEGELPLEEKDLHIKPQYEIEEDGVKKTETVTEMGDMNGAVAKGAESVGVPASVEKIDQGAFDSFPNQTISIGKNVVAFGPNTYPTNLQTLQFQDLRNSWIVIHGNQRESFDPTDNYEANATFYNNHRNWWWFKIIVNI